MPRKTKKRDSEQEIYQGENAKAKDDIHQEPDKMEALVLPSDKNEEPEELPWTVRGGKNTFLWFRSGALAKPPSNPPAEVFHMTFKFLQADSKLVSVLLQNHGLKEVNYSEKNFNLLWSGAHMKAHQFQSLRSYQRVNHFPRSYELTRKDRLCKNIERVQRLQGFKNFDLIPQTFVLPGDYKDLCLVHLRIRGPWIVKPVASSRGRGIYIVNNPDQIPPDETLVVAKYIDNPLLVDGYKCDLRLYVAVTCYNPLVIYLYEEGLVRLATVKYESSGQHLWNPCMHLCNYSINKYHEDYVKSEDPEAENVGNKWSLSALLRHLKSKRKDTSLLMTRIEDVIIKAILSAAPMMVSASRFVPYTRNCFELYGFDILIDSTLKPWLLEVNLSPSLSCDSPLDMRIKSAMVSDLLTLVGVPVVDPMVQQPLIRGPDPNAKQASSSTDEANKKKKGGKWPLNLSFEEIKLLHAIYLEYYRKGGFLRIFPSSDSWKRYGGFLDPTTGIVNVGNQLTQREFSSRNYNLLLHQILEPSKSPNDRMPNYERALLQGHNRPLTAVTFFNSNNKENISGQKTARECKIELRKSLEKGKQLSTNQARRLFSHYLHQVLSKLGPPLEGPNSPSELCLKFLQRAACTLRSSFIVKVPPNKLLGKDRVAVIARQLHDFLVLYGKETEHYFSDTPCESAVSEALLESFLCSSSERDMEEILLLHLKRAKCTHSFLGRCSPPFSSLKSQSLLHILSQFFAFAPGKTHDCCYRDAVMKAAPRSARPRISRTPNRSDMTFI